MWSNLLLGFETAMSLQSLIYCFVGVLLGTAIGALPGLGPLATIAMLLPVTYTLDPTSALIMLAGIYYGAQYGGSTTAILVNLPGESSSVVTCLDGHQMALQGRAGPALAVAALGSFFAGTVATLLVAAFAPLLIKVAFSFFAAEYFSLMVVGLMMAVVMSQGSILKALCSVALGLLLGCVGTDVNSGVQRFTFGIVELSGEIQFVALAMGFFAFTDIMRNAGQREERTLVSKTITSLWPSRSEFRQAWPAALRGTALGSLLGLLPGGGATLASFASYSLEKRISSNPEKFGKGAVAGVAGPESANNAAAQTSFVPMLTLGIPSNGVMALMMGAMMLHNIAPGPQVMSTNPALFWGLIASMWIGNLFLLGLNLPLIGIWVKLLRVRYDMLFPIILVCCVIGLYSIQNQVFEIYVAAVFAIVGYTFQLLRCEPAPLLLGFILGPLMEANVRRALLLSHGDLSTFVTRPISLSLLIIAALLLLTVLLPSIKNQRQKVFVEEE